VVQAAPEFTDRIQTGRTRLGVLAGEVAPLQSDSDVMPNEML
jgi:hypothetical protein